MRRWIAASARPDPSRSARTRTEKECSEVHVVVDRRACVARSLETSAEAVQDAGGDLVESQRAELRQKVPVDRVAVVTRRLRREVRCDGREVIGDELAEGWRLGRRTAESFRGANSDQRRTASSYVAALTVARLRSRPAVPGRYMEKYATPAASS